MGLANQGFLVGHQGLGGHGGRDLEATNDNLEIDPRFLEVCMDGDVEDLVQLFEEITRSNEILSTDDLNCVDGSGRVRFHNGILLYGLEVYIGFYLMSKACGNDGTGSYWEQ